MTVQKITRAIEYLTSALRYEIEGKDSGPAISWAMGELKGFSTVVPSPRAPLYFSNVNHGFDTVLGYLEREQPEVLDPMGDVVADTVRDGFALTARCKKTGVTPIKVSAPQALIDMGITEINSYPIGLLEARFG